MTDSEKNIEEGLFDDEAPKEAPQAAADAAIPAMASGKATAKSRLSIVSKAYDIDGDGQLDEAELAMRNMDATGRGYLTNEKVYALMNEHIKTQKELFKFKKVIIALAVFVVLLTLSNLGTSFAAAYLAKDTTTNKDGQLVNTDSGEAVSTQTTSESFKIQRQEVAPTEGGERDLVGYTERTKTYLTIVEQEGDKMISFCTSDKTVNVERTWHDESKTTKQICPASTKTLHSDGSLTLNPDTANEIKIQKYINHNIETGFVWYYLLDGDKLTQDVGQICDETADCDGGLECLPENRVCTSTTTTTTSTTTTTASTVGLGTDTKTTVCTADSSVPGIARQLDMEAPPDRDECQEDIECADSIYGEVCRLGTGLSVKVCGCNETTSAGCSSGENHYCWSWGYRGQCTCKDDSDCSGTTDSNTGEAYTCGFDCGVSIEYPTCNSKTNRDNYCQNGPYTECSAGYCSYEIDFTTGANTLSWSCVKDA